MADPSGGGGELRVLHEPLPLTCGFNLPGQGPLQGEVVRQWGVEEGATTTVVAGSL